MFTPEDRDNVRDHVLKLATSDTRITAGAAVGSLALGNGDRWSDLDLSFAVAGHCSSQDVLEEWTEKLAKEFDAAHLFDVKSGDSLYRVFLLPGCLQLDLSFTPESRFGAAGPKFRLLFGKSVQKPFPPPPSARELFGYAAHHALRARFCIERGRYWHAEYWISGARDYALSLACLRHNLPANYGRGFDDLPEDALEVFRPAFVAALTRNELLRALDCVIRGLLLQTHGIEELSDKVGPLLLELAEWK